MNGDEDPAKNVASLQMAAQQLTAEASDPDSAITAAPYIPPQPDDTTPSDIKEACEYYLTPRAQHPRAANKMLIRSLPLVLTFDAFAFTELYFT